MGAEVMEGEVRFRRAVEKVLAHEGGFVDDPLDPGGATNYGISLRYLRGLGTDIGDLDNDGDVDEQDIRKLSREQAIAIYRARWWDRYGLARIDDAGVAATLFDLMVNMGATTAVRLLQQSLNTCGQAVLVDGVLGPKTVDAINRTPAGWLLAELRLAAIRRYVSLVTANRKLSKFLLGWIRRALD